MMTAPWLRDSRKFRLAILRCTALLLGLLVALHPVRSPQAQQGPAVELELVLAIDTSLSVDAGEYALQIAGLALAFRDPNVVTAIEAVSDHGIAVALVQWGIGVQQETLAPMAAEPPTAVPPPS